MLNTLLLVAAAEVAPVPFGLRQAEKRVQAVVEVVA